MFSITRLEEAILSLNTQLKNLYVHLETELNEGLYIVLNREKETLVPCVTPLYGCPITQRLESRNLNKTLSQSKARLRYKSLLPSSHFVGRRPSFEQRLSQPLLALVRKIAVNKSMQAASSGSKSNSNLSTQKRFSTNQRLDAFYESLGKSDAFGRDSVYEHPANEQIVQDTTQGKSPGFLNGRIEVRNPFFHADSHFESTSLGGFLPEYGSIVTYQLTPWIEENTADTFFELTESEAHLLSRALEIRLY